MLRRTKLLDILILAAAAAAMVACGGKGGNVPPGAAGGDCYGNGTCNDGLVCSAQDVCVTASAGDDGGVGGDIDAGGGGGGDIDAGGGGVGGDIDAGGGGGGDIDAGGGGGGGGIDAGGGGDPCDGVTCALAPAPICVTGGTLREFDAPGECIAGVCHYAFIDQPCAESCVGGECVDPSCGAGSCDSPPADFCFDAQTLREHPELGTCDTGACDYAYVDTICTMGCAGGECAPGSWKYDIWPYIGEPTQVSLAVDALGRPHILYLDAGDLKLAELTTYGWSFSDVDPAIGEAVYASYRSIWLRVDAAGGLHALYTEQTNLNVRYAYRPPGGDWDVEFVATAGDLRALSLALTSDGVPVALWFDDTTNQLLSARRTPAGAWPQTHSATLLYTPSDVWMALDGDGAPIIAGYIEAMGQLGTPAGVTWTLAKLPSTSLFVRGIDYDPATSTLQLLTHSGVDGLMHLRRTGAGPWTTHTFTTVRPTPLSGSLAVDAAGHAHVVYNEESPSKLRYATDAGGSWTVTDLRAGFYNGWHWIEVDADASPRIATSIDIGHLVYMKPAE